eukprot:8426923-Pyramimonas_sp.AAC.1
MIWQNPDQLGDVNTRDSAIAACCHDNVVRQTPHWNVVPNQVLQAGHDQDLRIHASTKLDSIVTRRVGVIH